LIVLTEEGEQEEQENDRDTDGLTLCALWRRWRFGINGSDDDHADTHADGTDDEQELAAESVDGPGSVHSEEDTESSVESVDESNGRRVGKDLLVDLGGVGVEGTLSGNLLTSVDDESEQQTLANRSVLPQSTV